MMTREKFNECIEVIKSARNMEEEFNDWLGKYSDGGWCIFDSVSKMEDLIVEYMCIEIMGECPEYEENDIFYFLYELDFGIKYKPGMIMEGDKEIDFSTSDKLYDYLESKYGRKSS